jgi:hypothetical protein
MKRIVSGGVIVALALGTAVAVASSASAFNGCGAQARTITIGSNHDAQMTDGDYCATARVRGKFTIGGVNYYPDTGITYIGPGDIVVTSTVSGTATYRGSSGCSVPTGVPHSCDMSSFVQSTSFYTFS